MMEQERTMICAAESDRIKAIYTEVDTHTVRSTFSLIVYKKLAS